MLKCKLTSSQFLKISLPQKVQIYTGGQSIVNISHGQADGFITQIGGLLKGQFHKISYNCPPTVCP